MIYTITFNPSLDYIINVDKINLGKLNRSSSEIILSGGKGINVSIVLKNLGIENIALGFIAGFTGKEIEKILTSQKIKTDFIMLKDGLSRINIKIKSSEETEINCQGPYIYNNDINILCDKLKNLNKNDILILSGSIPDSLPNNTYKKILDILKNKNIKIVIDTTKKLLLNVLEYKPFLIKPNNFELEEIFNTKIETEHEIIKYSKELQNMGATNVLVSRGDKGAILVSKHGKIYKASAPKGTLINSVGAGDSMVAGFIAGYIENNDYEKAFKMGIACGSASAFSKNLATKQEIYKILELL